MTARNGRGRASHAPAGPQRNERVRPDLIVRRRSFGEDVLIPLFIGTLASFLLALWLTAKLSRPGSFLYVLDHPNPRSLHSRPTPRSGGIGILVAIYGITAAVVVVEQQAPGPVIALAVAGLVLGTVAYVDDRAPLSAGLRMAVHVGAAAGLAVSGLELNALDLPGFRWEPAGWLSGALTIVWIVWMINLYNFMDGMDGFAGGMAVIGFGALSLMGWLAGDPAFGLLAAVIAASAAGFLVYNFPPARIFMGDVGSSTLGLFAAGLVVWGVREAIFPLWIGVLVFSPFIVDATVTLARRALRGEKVWEAHRSHYYQRLVRAGWGHRRTVLLQYALMLGCAGSALVGVRLSDAGQWAIVAGWTAIYLAYFLGVSRLEARTGEPA